MNNTVENSYIGSKDFAISKLSVVTKLYVWSVIIEPLLFFVVFDPETFGVTANISKLFQFTIFIYLIIKVLILNRSFIVPSPFSHLNINFIYYFIWTVIVGFYGLYIGAYNIENDVITSEVGLKQSFRPIFEYIVLLYYFIYFMLLPRYFLNNAIAINYFFKVFTIVFYVLLFVGFGDLIVGYLGYDGIPRHLSDRTDIGVRFHGFAGEPRDAFVYLMFGLCIIALKGIWENTKKPSKILFLIVIIAALLTESFSGLLGILFFCGLYIVFGDYKLLDIKTYLYLIAILFFVAASVFLFDRTLIYLDAIYNFLFFTKATDFHDIENVTSILSVSLNNVNPIWQRFQEVMNFNLLPTMIGTGLGSSSITNINLFNVYEVSNPNANIIRTIFESGIIGLFIYILVFLKPLERIGASKQELFILKTAMLLMLGMFFGHRSPELFIFFGIVLAVYKVKSQSRKKNI
jgi:hypothetical protein